MKHFEVRKNTPLRIVFSTLFSVFHLVMKHYVSCLIYYVLNASKWKRWPKISKTRVFVACAWSSTYVTTCNSIVFNVDSRKRIKTVMSTRIDWYCFDDKVNALVRTVATPVPIVLFTFTLRSCRRIVKFLIWRTWRHVKTLSRFRKQPKKNNSSLHLNTTTRWNDQILS